MILVDENRNIIQHYGVLGMKWGVRKSEYESLRNKAENVYKTQSSVKNNIPRADLKSALWLSKTTSQKVFSTAFSASVNALVSYNLTKALNPSALSDPKKLVKTIGLNAVKNAAIMAVSKEIASKSAMKRYTDSGQKDMSKKQYKHISPEQIGEKAFGLALRVAPLVIKAGTIGVKSAYVKKMENKARVDSWGNRLLNAPGKGSTMHTIFDDGYMSILEKIGS